MSTVVALGSSHELEGFALAGVTVIEAKTDTELIDAWRCLDSDVGLVIFSAPAELALQQFLDERPDVLTAAMP
ncbi:MAG: hypothetical protein DRJ50_10030 [Actinobacteria bacterium]|nr:MAG: hypothetical protein DRJ50_10030 [Actinomycetota bacterium]